MCVLKDYMALEVRASQMGSMLLAQRQICNKMLAIMLNNNL